MKLKTNDGEYYIFYFPYIGGSGWSNITVDGVYNPE